MLHALKASVTVTAGVILDEPMPELTRSWSFTNVDIANGEALNNDNKFTYLDGMGAALNYAATLQNPQRCNWVKLEWIWL